MALPVITSRPIKFIDGYKSEWNAASTPIVYGITNTKWPVNSEDSTVAITSITDTNGNATLQHGSSTGIIAKEWVLVAGTTNYNGAHQVLSVSTNALIIDFPFGASETGTSQVYFQNYTSLIRVYAGINPTHFYQVRDPITLIGTIEQRPDTTNITLADVKDFVKDKLNTTYDETQSSWQNDLNGWADFYISFAERYDQVFDGNVIDFTSEFRDDEADGGINYLKAVQGGLQFGAARGGNMHDYVIKDTPYMDVALFMTDFERPGVIADKNFNLSIIIEHSFPLYIRLKSFDNNDNQLQNFLTEFKDNDYGLYRLALNRPFTIGTEYLQVSVENLAGTTLTEIKEIDVFCPVTTLPLSETGRFLLLEDDEFILLESGDFILLE